MAAEYRPSNGKNIDENAGHSTFMGYSAGYGQINDISRRVINGKAYIDVVGKGINPELRNGEKLIEAAAELDLEKPTFINHSGRSQGNGVVRFATADIVKLADKLAEKDLIMPELAEFIAEQESVPGITAIKLKSFVDNMRGGNLHVSAKLARGKTPGKSDELDVLQDYARAHLNEIAAVFEGKARDVNSAATAVSAIIAREHAPHERVSGGWVLEFAEDAEMRRRNIFYADKLQGEAIESFLGSQMQQSDVKKKGSWQPGS